MIRFYNLTTTVKAELQITSNSFTNENIIRGGCHLASGKIVIQLCTIYLFMNFQILFWRCCHLSAYSKLSQWPYCQPWSLHYYSFFLPRSPWWLNESNDSECLYFIDKRGSSLSEVTVKIKFHRKFYDRINSCHPLLLSYPGNACLES